MLRVCDRRCAARIGRTPHFRQSRSLCSVALARDAQQAHRRGFLLAPHGQRELPPQTLDRSAPTLALDRLARDLEAVGDFFVDERLVEGVKGGCFRYFEAFPDLHVALDDVIAEGDRVFVRSTMTGTHDGEYKGIPATGRHVAAESAEVFRIADGRFVGYWCLTNVAGLMRQLTEEPAAATA
jgi:predicted ester cyclase